MIRAVLHTNLTEERTLKMTVPHFCKEQNAYRLLQYSVNYVCEMRK